MKRFYYSTMYEITDSIMWLVINDREHYARWWRISEGFRAKRDAVA